MSEPDLTPLAEASYEQLLAELKHRTDAAVIGTLTLQREAMSGAHSWGGAVAQAGLGRMIYELTRHNVKEWLLENTTGEEDDAKNR